jgi:flagellar biosynthetic protein FliR
MVLLPGLGESAAPARVRIAMALGVTFLILPGLESERADIPETGMILALMIAGEVLTGLWFGWLARMIAVALPMGGQLIGYLVGLSSVLQPDPELGSQTTVPGKMFEMALPAIILSSGAYTLPLTAIDGLFRLIPLGHMLPVDDNADFVIRTVGSAFSLAVQLASPFVAADIVWHIVIGQIAKVGSRMQIYFVSVPGQILGGMVMLMLTCSAIVEVWKDSAFDFCGLLPGSR